MNARNEDLPLGGFVKFKPLAVDASRITASFDQVVKALHGAPFSGVARFTLLGAPENQKFVVAVGGGTAKLEHAAKTVDFEIITTPDTWLAIAQGALAPLEAFARGKMRVRGDQKLGQRIMKWLSAGADGRVDFC